MPSTLLDEGLSFVPAVGTVPVLPHRVLSCPATRQQSEKNGWWDMERRTLHNVTLLSITLLLIAFLDELVYGAREAAWPLIRTTVGLDYAQVGLLLSLPNVIANVVEPFLGVLGDVWKRRVLILVGGVMYALALLLFAGSRDFPVLLFAAILLAPASSTFVSLSQATLMDLDPSRHEQHMARWTFAGSAGAVAGPLALGAVVALRLGWRALFAGLVGVTLLALAMTWGCRVPVAQPAGGRPTFRAGVSNALRALRRREVLRWLSLLECSDLMLDILPGYLALYFVDVVGVTAPRAGLAVALWMGVGLLGSLVLIPLLERMPGLRYLRISAALALALFPAFLLVPGFGLKLVLLGLLGFSIAGWYAVLKGQLYSAMLGQSGTVLSLGSVFGLARALLPLALGLVAQRFHLGVALWLLLLGPIALLLGLPRSSAPQSPVAME
jgi:MFS transporter, FSR family, fosmidomycin resistance protein